MATKKEVKMRDLKPSKDAKGGAARQQGATRQGGNRNLQGNKQHLDGGTRRGN